VHGMGRELATRRSDEIRRLRDRGDKLAQSMNEFSEHLSAFSFRGSEHDNCPYPDATTRGGFFETVGDVIWEYKTDIAITAICLMLPGGQVAALGTRAGSAMIRVLPRIASWTRSCATKVGGNVTKLLGFERKVAATTNTTTQVAGKTLTNSKELYDLDRLSAAGQAMDRGGLTRAGRALEKHGGRPNSVFPKPTGTLLDKNIGGQNCLNDILTHPNGYIKSNRFGGVNYYKPDGSGACFCKDGTFRGFLEPNL
ncbi:MAG: hypothetical protein JSR46_07605, partial [Verrucomicrobia bacterium]|nr:hypothetical protein [Verrucomicrobiota bacterium]